MRIKINIPTTYTGWIQGQSVYTLDISDEDFNSMKTDLASWLKNNEDIWLDENLWVTEDPEFIKEADNMSVAEEDYKGATYSVE